MAAPAQIGALTSFSSGTTIVSSEVNANFSDIRTEFNRLVNSNGGLYVGDDANANQSGAGITINQGGADDEILSLKSSDVAHALVSVTETDTYGAMRKLSATNGGLRIDGYGEDDSVTQVLQLNSFGGQAPTGKTSSDTGLISCAAYEHDGADSLANITANGNVFAVRGYVGGGLRSLFLVDEDGDFFYDGADGGAFDSYDDTALVRALSRAISPREVIRDQWDRLVAYNEADLIEAGILGAPVAEGGLVNGSQVQRLLIGAVWQLQAQIHDLRARLA